MLFDWWSEWRSGVWITVWIPNCYSGSWLLKKYVKYMFALTKCHYSNPHCKLNAWCRMSGVLNMPFLTQVWKKILLILYFQILANNSTRYRYSIFSYYYRGSTKKRSQNIDIRLKNESRVWSPIWRNLKYRISRIFFHHILHQGLSVLMWSEYQNPACFTLRPKTQS